MQDSPFVLGFTSGELSPWLSTRFDLQAYQRGAALLQNFMVQPYGGLCRRCGTQYVCEAAVQDPDAVRLIPFRFSESDALLLEMFPGGMRVFREGGPVRTASGEIYQLSAPWTDSAELRAMRYTQVNDVVYLTSVYRAPLVLSRYADNDWLCREYAPEPFPRETYLPQADELRVRMESNGYYAELYLDSSRGVFHPEMNGSEIVVAEAEIPSRTLFLNQSFSFDTKPLPNLASSGVVNDAVYTERDEASGMYHFYSVIRVYEPSFYNGGKSARDYPECFMPGVMLLDKGKPYEVCGDWELRTYGEWDAVWELWRSYDTESRSLDFKHWQWSCIRTVEQNACGERENYIISGSEDVPCRMVLVCRSATSASPGAHVYFNILGGRREYKFRIVSLNSAFSARAAVLSHYMEPCASFRTRYWSFGAYGSRNGYPAFSSFYQGRMWLGGFPGLPTTLIASAANDFANFRVSSSADSALHLTISSDNQSRICWICPARSLLVGTSESEWTLSSHDGSALSPTNASFTRQSSVGSESAAADAVENTIFYIQRGRQRLREISYKLAADGYTSTDTSLLAEHLFATGVKEWAVQRGNGARLWVLMQDNSLAVLTTNVEQQVTAWQRVAMQGRDILHLAALPGQHAAEDELWFVVRNRNSGCISLERLAGNAGFVDGCVVLDAAVGEHPLLTHLAGLEVLVYPVEQPQQAVVTNVAADGSLLLPPEGNVCVGARYGSELRTLPLEDMRTYNTVRQEGRVRLRLLESDPAFRYKATHAENWECYDPAADFRSYPYTGEVRVSQIPTPGVGQGFALCADSALDFRLVSMTVEFDFHGR